MFTAIAGEAGEHDIIREVRSASRKRNDVIDRWLLHIDATPIATTVLLDQLRVKIGRRELTWRLMFPGPLLRIVGSHPFRIILCPRFLCRLTFIFVASIVGARIGSLGYWIRRFTIRVASAIVSAMLLNVLDVASLSLRSNFISVVSVSKTVVRLHLHSVLLHVQLVVCDSLFLVPIVVRKLRAHVGEDKLRCR